MEEPTLEGPALEEQEHEESLVGQSDETTATLEGVGLEARVVVGG